MKKILCGAVAVTVVAAIFALAGGVEEIPPYYEIAVKMGFEDTETQPAEITELTIPGEFSPVYEKYNRLLNETGYDLLPYRGKKCKKYTYNIPSVNARLNVIVCNDKIIGGDISAAAIDGIMIPIIKE